LIFKEKSFYLSGMLINADKYRFFLAKISVQNYLFLKKVAHSAEIKPIELKYNALN